jgi:hypothetical protein
MLPMVAVSTEIAEFCPTLLTVLPPSVRNPDGAHAAKIPSIFAIYLLIRKKLADWVGQQADTEVSTRVQLSTFTDTHTGNA